MSTARLLSLSVIIFLAELAVGIHYSDDILHLEHPLFQGARVVNMKMALKEPSDLYIIGGSTACVGFGNERILSGILNKKVAKLCESQQGILDEIALIDNIPPGKGIVVHTAYLARMAESSESVIHEMTHWNDFGSYLVRSPSVDAIKLAWQDRIHDAAPWQERIVPEMNRVLFMGAYALNKLRSHPANVIHLLHQSRAGGKGDADPKMELSGNFAPAAAAGAPVENYHPLIGDLQLTRKRMRSLVETNLANIEFLREKAYQASRAKGLSFAIFEMPYPSAFNKCCSDEIARYRENLAAFAARHPDVKFYAYRDSVLHDNSPYFRDFTHMSDEGIAFYRPYIVKGLQYVLE